MRESRRSARESAREAEKAFVRRQVERSYSERQQFVERMIDQTAAGLVDWTQPVPIGGGLFACHYRSHPDQLYICAQGGRMQGYSLTDAKARELMRLILLQQAGLIARAS